jgi:hypothetical protein
MVKQYVNLPTKSKDHHGSRVPLEVEASNLGAGKIGVSYWWVEDAPGATNTDLKYLSSTERARPRRTRTRNKKKKFRNTALLPHAGGDKYKVKCSKNKDHSDPKDVEEFETWRKIFYTVHYMNAQCLATFNAVKGRFEAAYKDDAFIELEQSTIKKTLLDEPHTLATDPALGHLYKKNPPLKRKPFHLRIVVLNDIYDLINGRYTETGVSSKVTTITSDNPLSDISAKHFLRRARARVEPSGTSYSIRKFVTKTGDDTIEVDLTKHKQLSKAIDKGKTIRIVVATRERDHYLGHSLGNFCCVRINETGTPAEIETTILQTFTHEVGHGFQQVVEREANYDGAGNFSAWENNPMWHDDDYGGQGPHCHTNAKLDPDPDTASGQTYIHDSGTLCTMFFRDDDDVDVDGKFCAGHCIPRLKRVNLDKAHMKAQGWNRF